MIIYIYFNTTLYKLSVLPNCTIQQFKQVIVPQTCVPAAKQIILYNNKILDDKKTLIQCSIKEESVLMVKVVAKQIDQEVSQKMSQKVMRETRAREARLKKMHEIFRKEAEQSAKKLKRMIQDAVSGQLFTRKCQVIDLQSQPQKLSSHYIVSRMIQDIPGRDCRLKSLQYDIKNPTKPSQVKKEGSTFQWPPILRGQTVIEQRQVQARPRRQVQKLKGAEFFQMLKTKGIRDEILSILMRHEVQSTQILKECTEERLILIGIPLAQIITLKKIYQN